MSDQGENSFFDLIVSPEEDEWINRFWENYDTKEEERFCVDYSKITLNFREDQSIPSSQNDQSTPSVQVQGKKLDKQKFRCKNRCCSRGQSDTTRRDINRTGQGYSKLEILDAVLRAKALLSEIEALCSSVE